MCLVFFFFFQAEDGIRDLTVTGVQTWLFRSIGHLQRNKAKLVPGRFVLVQSVDSLALAEELERRAAARGVTQRVLLQVNVAGGGPKSGCALGEAPPLARAGAPPPGLGVEGLVARAPPTHDVGLRRRPLRGRRPA